MSPQDAPQVETVATNRKARLRFDIVEKYEAGMALVGSEVKQLREKRCNIEASFVRPKRNELWLIESSIPLSPHACFWTHEEKRERKLLLHRKQIDTIIEALKSKGTTCVPMRIYFKEGRAKAEIAVVKGRTYADERQAIREREAKREVAQALKVRVKR